MLLLVLIGELVFSYSAKLSTCYCLRVQQHSSAVGWYEIADGAQRASVANSDVIVKAPDG